MFLSIKYPNRPKNKKNISNDKNILILLSTTPTVAFCFFTNPTIPSIKPVRASGIIKIFTKIENTNDIIISV